LGLERDDFPKIIEEKEQSEILLWIGKENFKDIDIINTPKNWFGKANILSKSQDTWNIIHQVSEETKGSIILKDKQIVSKIPTFPIIKSQKSLEDVIRTRRSAQSYDHKTILEIDKFITILSRLIPEYHNSFFNFFPNYPRINIIFYIHRVDKLLPGIYILIRNTIDLDEIKKWKPDKFTPLWKKFKDIPDELNFYQLYSGDVEEVAKTFSCDQDIASDSFFACSMITDFNKMNDFGPHSYKEMYWECGFLGQILYLESESLGYRSTGIGCFFDDPITNTLGCQDNFETLYNFSVGNPIEDKRISTKIPYE
jgi:hypothetical protein